MGKKGLEEILKKILGKVKGMKKMYAKWGGWRDSEEVLKEDPIFWKKWEIQKEYNLMDEKYGSIDPRLGLIVVEGRFAYQRYLEEEKIDNIETLLNPLTVLEENYQFLKECDKSFRDNFIKLIQYWKRDYPSILYVFNSFLKLLSDNYTTLRELPLEVQKRIFFNLGCNITYDGVLVHPQALPKKFDVSSPESEKTIGLIKDYKARPERLKIFLELGQGFELHSLIKKFREKCQKRNDYDEEKTDNMVEHMLQYALESGDRVITRKQIVNSDFKGIEILMEIYSDYYPYFEKDNVLIGKEIIYGLNKIIYRNEIILPKYPSKRAKRDILFQDLKEAFQKYFPEFADFQKITVCSPREMLEFVNVKKELKRKKDANYAERIFSLIKKGGKKEGCKSLEEIAECAKLEIPGYQIEQKIGAGVYKKVFLGLNIYSNEKKALKIVEISERGLKNIREMGLTEETFLGREAQKSIEIKDIGNPNLSKVEDVRYEPKINHYVIYEEVFEKTLERMVQEGEYKQGVNLNRARLIDHLTQLSCGLAALHSKGIVHGDLTLNNIGIKKGIIKITDFGLASSLGNLAYEVGEQINVGSIITRAPELFEGKPSTDKSDVWSFGVIAYTMVTEEYPPFIPKQERPKKPGKMRMAYENEIKKMIEKTDLSSLSNDPNIPSRIRKILKCTLLRAPEDRTPISKIYSSLSNPLNLIYTHYTEKCDNWIAEYPSKKEELPYWLLPFSTSWLDKFDYIFIANQRGDLLAYKKTLSLEDGKAKNPFTPFPEAEKIYKNELMTLELREAVERNLPSGMGAFRLNPFYHSMRYYLIYSEGGDRYEKGMKKKILLFSHPTYRESLENFFNVEEITQLPK